MDKYKYKRRQIRKLQEDLGSMQHTLDNLTADEQASLGGSDHRKTSESDKFTERTGRSQGKEGQRALSEASRKVQENSMKRETWI